MNIVEALKVLPHNGKMKIKDSNFYVWRSFDRGGKRQLYRASKTGTGRYSPEFEHLISEDWELIKE